jgi:hypothetical protein
MDMLEIIRDKVNQYGLSQITISDVQWLIDNLQYNRDRKDEVLVQSGDRWIKLSKIKQIIEED